MPVSSSFELNANEQSQLNALVWQVVQHGVTQQKFELPEPPATRTLLQSGASFVHLVCRRPVKEDAPASAKPKPHCGKMYVTMPIQACTTAALLPLTLKNYPV